MKTYAIIDFKSGDKLETAIVPTVWLNHASKTCYWPNRPVPSRAVVDCIQPEKCWSIFPFVGIKYESNDYRKAAEKFKQLMNGFSDIASTSENEECLQRRRRLAHKKRHWSSSESDEEALGASTTERHSEELQLPKLSFVTKAPQPPVQVAASNAASQTSQETAVPVHQNNSDERTTQQVLKILEEMRANQEELKEKVNQVLHILKVNDDQHFGETAAEDFLFPLKTEEHLQRLEENLKDDEMKRRIMKYLSCIGGDSVTTLVRNILRRIFSTPLALQYNFTGIKGKKGFLALKVRGVMMNAIRRTFPTATEMEINTVARKWFISARDRDGGRHRRLNSTADSGSPSRLSGDASVGELMK